MSVQVTDRSVDVLVCSAQKDFPKLPYALNRINKYVEDINKIHLITPVPCDIAANYDNVVSHLDCEVLDIDFSRWKFRPRWVYQQFLKLFQNVTQKDRYLVVDSDVMLNQPLPLFTATGKMIYYIGLDQQHVPYFVFNEKMLGLSRAYDRSFILDMSFFDRNIIREMLDRFDFTSESFIERSFHIIERGCYISEQELYGNYVTAYHPDYYVIRELMASYLGRKQSRWDDVVWDRVSIEKCIEEIGQTDCHLFALHSWDNARKKGLRRLFSWFTGK